MCDTCLDVMDDWDNSGVAMTCMTRTLVISLSTRGTNREPKTAPGETKVPIHLRGA